MIEDLRDSRVGQLVRSLQDESPDILALVDQPIWLNKQSAPRRSKVAVSDIEKGVRGERKRVRKVSGITSRIMGLSGLLVNRSA